MKISKKISFAALFLFVQMSAFCQSTFELGFKVNAAPRSRYQFELRKSMTEKTMFRLSFIVGDEADQSGFRTLGANDSLMYIRTSNYKYTGFEWRTGFQYKLGDSRFSFDGDFVIGYSSIFVNKYTTPHAREDFYGTGGAPAYAYEFLGVQNYTEARWHMLSAGLSLGFSWEYPLGPRTTLSAHAGAVLTYKHTIAQHEVNDFGNEFQPTGYSGFDFYFNAGIGLTWKLGKLK
jgi:hypothetical protein